MHQQLHGLTLYLLAGLFGLCVEPDQDVGVELETHQVGRLVQRAVKHVKWWLFQLHHQLGSRDRKSLARPDIERYPRPAPIVYEHA